MDNLFEVPELGTQSNSKPRRLLWLFGLFLVLVIYATIDGRIFNLFNSNSVSQDLVVEEIINQTEEDTRTKEELAQIDFKRHNLPIKRNYSAPNQAADPINEPSQVYETVTDWKNDQPEAKTETGNNPNTNDDGTPAETNSTTLTTNPTPTGEITSPETTVASPVTVTNPLEVGTPNSVTLSGVISNVDVKTDTITIEAENNEYKTTRVKVSGAGIYLDGLKIRLTDLEVLQIISVTGSQYSGSNNITANSITVTGVMELIPIESGE